MPLTNSVPYAVPQLCWRSSVCFSSGSKQRTGNGSTVRVLLFDYRKAFDFIDHRVLIGKLKQINISNSIINWIIEFLSGRIQRVKLGRDCLSEWGKVPCGVPHGTKIDPWVFLLMINDLSVPSIFDIRKYVDDTRRVSHRKPLT